jgi:hypothetical protein
MIMPSPASSAVPIAAVRANLLVRRKFRRDAQFVDILY